MDLINQELGRRLTVQEVAALVGRSSGSVYKRYRDYGGIKDGRLILFFEKWVLEALQRRRENAHSQDRSQGTIELVREDQPPLREERREKVRIEKGSPRVGDSGEVEGRALRKDRHSLFGVSR